MISLQRRLQFGLAVGLVSLMGIVWAVGDYFIQGLSEDVVTARLQRDSQGLLRALKLGPEPTRLRLSRIIPIYDLPLSGHYYLVRLADGRTIGSASLGGHTLEVPWLEPGESRRMRVEGPEGQQLVLLLDGVRKQGREFTLAVTEELMSLPRDPLRRNFILLVLGGLLAMLLLQHVAVHGLFRPMGRVREDLGLLEPGGTELLSEEVPVEILPLVQELNRLRTLVAHRLDRSRKALNNLAHALKRPLTLLIRYLDEEEKGGGGQQPIEVGHQAERIHQLMDRELKRVRLKEPGNQDQPFDPHGDLAGLLAILQQRYQDRSLEICCQVEEGMSPFGDREELLELLDSLLDNACQWASARVSCQLSGAEEIHIDVSDDRAGLSDGDLRQLASPENRLDESAERHVGRLAIARDIVELYGGTLEFDRSEEQGGLEIRIVLPGDSVENEG